MRIQLVFSMSFLFSILTYGQSTSIGLLHHNDEVSEGFTLFSPEKNNAVYLINNCGEMVNSWTFSEKPGLTCYLLENGNLLRAGRDSLEIRDWNNSIIWTYDMAGNGLSQHHDIEPLPNGNILCVVHDIYTPSEIIAEGRDPAITGAEFKLDKIVEISPVGNNDATIVWEWKFIDHFIQDFDNTKDNYGIVEDFPELIDLNFDNGKTVDWTHVNGIDYNADLDQIIISTRHLDELHIIDHSTTTVEAAGHTGGNSNMGGDIMWRWGNPQVYRQGGISDQKLFLQHDAKWVQNGFLDEGKISVFNNGGDGNDTHSSIHLIEPTEVNGFYSKLNDIFLPTDYNWSWTGDILNEPFHEGKKCGVQALQNGNLLLCETSKGQFTEVNKLGEILWVYKNPTGETNYQQYNTVLDALNAIFRAEKYLPDFAGFNGVNLDGQLTIENLNLNSDTCAQSLGMNTETVVSDYIINPVINNEIVFKSNIKSILVFDLKGRLVARNLNLTSQSHFINIKRGMYFVEAKTMAGQIVRGKIIIQ